MFKFERCLKGPRTAYNALQNIHVQDRSSPANPREFAQKVIFPTRIQEVPYSNPGSTPTIYTQINTLNAELNPIFHLLALLRAHHILHFSRVTVNVLN